MQNYNSKFKSAIRTHQENFDFLLTLMPYTF